MNTSNMSFNERKQQLENWKQKKALQARTASNNQGSLPRSIKIPDQKSQTRQQLNQTGGNFVSKLQSNVLKTLGTHIKPDLHNISVTSQSISTANIAQYVVSKGRLDCEIDLIYSLYRKTIDMNEKNAPIQVKNTHDPEKWKKKFILFFNREKVIDFSGQNLFPFENKHLNVKIKAMNKQGEKIMKHNAKFWIVYIKLIQDKITLNNLSIIRDEMISLFKDSSDYSLIFQELGQFLNLPSHIDKQETLEKENLNPFELQLEDKITTKDNNDMKLVNETLDTIEQIQVENIVQEVPQKQQTCVESFTKPLSNQDMNCVSILDINETNQQQQQQQNDVDLIPAPSQDYVVKAPIEMSQVSIASTPNFKEQIPVFTPMNSIATCKQELKEEIQNNTFGEEEENIQQSNQINCQMAFLNFEQPSQNDNHNDQVQEDQYKQTDLPDQNQMVIDEKTEVDDMEINNQQIPLIIISEPVNDNVQIDIVPVDIHKEEEIQVETQIVSENCQQQSVELDLTISQVQCFDSKQQVDQEDNQIKDVQIDHDQIEVEEIKEVQRVSKKRKRSKSPMVSPSMTLRSKYKKKKITNDDCYSQPINEQQLEGASYFRYEIIEKKDVKYLVPVRYSIRNQEGNADPQIERYILEKENDIEYQPNDNEDLFAMDKSTQEIKKILKSRTLDIEDISEVVIQDLGNKGNFSLIKLAPSGKEKYGGNDQVIASLGRFSVSPSKKHGQFKEMMDHLYKVKKVRELMMTDASEEAKHFIKNYHHK